MLGRFESPVTVTMCSTVVLHGGGSCVLPAGCGSYSCEPVRIGTESAAAAGTAAHTGCVLFCLTTYVRAACQLLAQWRNRAPRVCCTALVLRGEISVHMFGQTNGPWKLVHYSAQVENIKEYECTPHTPISSVSRVHHLICVDMYCLFVFVMFMCRSRVCVLG